MYALRQACGTCNKGKKLDMVSMTDGTVSGRAVSGNWVDAQRCCDNVERVCRGVESRSMPRSVLSQHVKGIVSKRPKNRKIAALKAALNPVRLFLPGQAYKFLHQW
jgi:hypothetical protein